LVRVRTDLHTKELGDMVNNLIKCSLIGGIILFLWSAFFWVVLPWNVCQRMHFSDEQEVAKVIKNNAPQSGIYVLPNLHQHENNPEAMKMAKERMHHGPFVFAAVSLHGKNHMLMKAMAQSLIYKIIIAGFVAWLLLQTTKLGYKKSVKFVTIAGLATALAATVPYSIWFGFSGAFLFCMVIELVIGWFLAALAIAKLSK
jgi:hypothetical protein